jgi:hypothetical protein
VSHSVAPQTLVIGAQPTATSTRITVRTDDARFIEAEHIGYGGLANRM